MKEGNCMWTIRGFIVHKGHYPDTAEYLIYNDYEREVTWTDDSNQATIFDTKDYIKWLCKEFGITEYLIRMVIMSDIEVPN